jgi:ribosomal protein L37AE/L43A
MNRKLERSTELAETLLLDLLLSKQSKSLIIVTRSEKEAKQFFSTLRSSVERLSSRVCASAAGIWKCPVTDIKKKQNKKKEQSEISKDFAKTVKRLLETPLIFSKKRKKK